MGIVDDSEFVLSNKELPQAFVGYLDNEIYAIENIRKTDIEPTQKIKKEWNAFLNRVPPDDDQPYYCPGEHYTVKDPLLNTNWNQTAGYNEYCQNLGCSNTTRNQKAYTGCVATALAQIMKYNQYPNYYNWSDMPNNWGSLETSRLMSDIGNKVDMDYGCDSSGANSSKAKTALANYGYNNVIQADYNYNIVQASIAANKPVYLSGGEYYGFLGLKYKGHAWVADGYQDSYFCTFDDNGHITGGYGYLFFHMNWGWGGAYNGWFGLSNFNPNGHNYNEGRKMIIYNKP